MATQSTLTSTSTNTSEYDTHPNTASSTHDPTKDARQICWKILRDSAVHEMCEVEWKSMSSLLNRAAMYRFSIEKSLNHIFPGDSGASIASSDASGAGCPTTVDLFGKMRLPIGNWGRVGAGGKPNSSSGIDAAYFPYDDDDDDSIDCIYTPTVGKYAFMEDHLRGATNLRADAWKGNHQFTIHKLMFKKTATVKQITFRPPSGYTIPLSTIWYEHSDSLLNSLRSIPQNDSRFMRMQFNPNLYRTIYHSPKSSHLRGVRYLDDTFPYNKCVDLPSQRADKVDVIMRYVDKAYWLLSHLTLYYRGSAAITEMVCSVLATKAMRQGIADKRTMCIRARDDDLCRYPDMMAMISNWDDWQGQFDFFLETKVIPSASIIDKQIIGIHLLGSQEWKGNGGSLLKLLEQVPTRPAGHRMPRSEEWSLVSDIIANPGNATYVLDLLGALGDSATNALQACSNINSHAACSQVSDLVYDILDVFCSEFD